MTELRAVAEWASRQGARFLSVLPMLAGKFDTPDCDPSPYSPMSRLFWNDIYLDPIAIAKKRGCVQALEIFASKDFTDEIEECRNTSFVDYFRVYQLKRKALELILKELASVTDMECERFHEIQSRLFEKIPEFKIFCATKARLKEYSAWTSSNPWQQLITQFGQFEMDLALKEFQKTSPCPLYMDYPLGVNDTGFDATVAPDLFARGLWVGAPPEPGFDRGQNWGFAPLHPLRLGTSGFQYFYETLKLHCQTSGILRIDHVMGLYRIFAVPKDQPNKDGVFFRYPSNLLFSLALLAAYEENTDLIGEDLGTVPTSVKELLVSTQIKSMAILQLELGKTPEEFKKMVTPRHLVAVNNHDMGLWSAFVQGLDLKLMVELNQMDPALAKIYQQQRLSNLQIWAEALGLNLALIQKALLGDSDHQNPNSSKREFYSIEGALKFIFKTGACYAVVSLEDLWGETQPQNIPGTYREYPNWRRKFSKTIAELRENFQLLWE